MRTTASFILGVLALGFPVLALAHSPYPGVRGFYVGAMHPLTTPSHVLMIIAISILLGIRVTESRMRYLIAVFSATATGLIMAFVLSGFFPSALLILLVTTVMGGLIIIPASLPGWVFVMLAGLSGFLLALESIPDPGAFLDVLITVIGSLVGIHYLIMYGSKGAAYSLERWDSQVLQIGIKVIGSWITAIGLLMLALTMANLI